MDIVAADSPLEQSRQREGQPKEGESLKESARLAKRWATELSASKKWLKKFTERGERCEQAYMDDVAGSRGKSSRVNLFWSNVQVTLAAIYGRLPKATVDRKYRDFSDDVARVAGMMLERLLNADLEVEHDNTNPAMRDAVQDRFVAGLGQVWCRYDVQTEEIPGQQPGTPIGERILDEQCVVEYVLWSDFRYAPCRNWKECRWVARAVYMDEDHLKERFHLSDEQASMVPMSNRSFGDTNPEDVFKATPFSQARIWEVWDKEHNQCIWYCEGCPFVLDYDDDILQLDNFFPCPQPVVATCLTKAFLPKADWVMAKDLYEELNEVNDKLRMLEKAVKAVGVYDKNATSVKKLLSEGVENEMLPVENWSAFVEKGGLKGVVDWMPVEAYVNAITQLTQRKQVLQRDLYELLGISDIMRGASVASETATAQQLKVQYGGARLAKLQADVARFVGEVMRIRAEIICNHFQPETIIKRSLIEKTPDAPLAQPAVQLLKDQRLAQYAIKVDAASMAAPDWDQEKQIRTEFMGAVSNYVMAAAPMVQNDPKTGIFLLKLLQWGCAGFKGSESIEGVIDQAVAAFEQQQASPPPPAPPSPKDQKDSASAKKSEADAGKSVAETEAVQIENEINKALIKSYDQNGGLGQDEQMLQQPIEAQPFNPAQGLNPNLPQGIPLPPQNLPEQRMPSTPLR